MEAPPPICRPCGHVSAATNASLQMSRVQKPTTKHRHFARNGRTCLFLPMHLTIYQQLGVFGAILTFKISRLRIHCIYFARCTAHKIPGGAVGVTRKKSIHRTRCLKGLTARTRCKPLFKSSKQLLQTLTNFSGMRPSPYSRPPDLSQADTRLVLILCLGKDWPSGTGIHLVRETRAVQNPDMFLDRTNANCRQCGLLYAIPSPKHRRFVFCGLAPSCS